MLLPVYGKRADEHVIWFRSLVARKQFVFSNRWLWVATIASMVVNVGISSVTGIILPWIVSRHMHRPPTLYGIVISGMTVGSVATSVFLGSIRGLKRPGTVSYGAMVLLGLSIASLAWVQTYVLLVFVATLFGAATTVLSLVWSVTLQDLVPLDTFGRVVSVDMFLSYLALPMSLTLVGWVSTKFGVVEATEILGALVCVATCLGWLYGGIAWDSHYAESA